MNKEKEKQKLDRYEMHKYWGKKPSRDLSELINKYSTKNDIVFDPFSGYGVFICESILEGRKAISNDLNPMSNFILKQLLETNVDLTELKKEVNIINKKILPYQKKWYIDSCPNCGKEVKVLATLRNKNDVPLINKLSCNCSKKAISKKITDASILSLLETNTKVGKHPISKLFKNGRICVKENMTTDSFFTTRSLDCHTFLYKQINKIKNDNIKNLILLAFTSNLANCSKLVPPIKSRGELSPGAWMTGFYIGEEYLEQNVFHYFNNRIKKVIDGKSDFLKILKEKLGIEKLNMNDYSILNEDAKKLSLHDESIDYIFTDPPYGDSVPYFEQSIIWNTWLGNTVDYNNEIVISDSKERNKNPNCFSKDIEIAIYEIYRVLKDNKYFSMTYHSLSGKEWYALTTACLKAGFILKEFKIIEQKTFSPRQLNRKKTIKGDILVTFKKEKTNFNKNLVTLSKEDTKKIIINLVDKELLKAPKNTNDLYNSILKYVFEKHIIFSDTDFIDVFSEHYNIDDNGFWFKN